LSSTVSNSSPDNGAATLPLESLINGLKENGFSIKPDDYIEILKIVERFQPASLRDAANLICPLIVTNAEEQERFAVVFKKICGEKDDVIIEDQLPWWKIFFTKKNRIYLLFIPVVAFAIWLIYKDAKKTPVLPPVTPSIEVRGDYIYAVRPGDSVQLDITKSFKSAADTSRVTWEWDLGKGWQHRNEQNVLFIIPPVYGNYDVSVRMMQGNDTVGTSKTLTICEHDIPMLHLKGFSEYYTLGDTIRLEAAVGKEYGTVFPTNPSVWIFNNDTISKDSRYFEHLADLPGTNTVRFSMLPLPGDSLCNPPNDVSFTFITEDPDAKEIRIDTVQTGNIIQSPRRISKNVVSWLIFLFLFSLALRIVLDFLGFKRQKEVEEIIESKEKEASDDTEKKPPYEIPLENHQQQLIASEPMMNDVMRFMQQRTRDESLALNIPMTVHNTIRSGGIPELVYSNKLRPNDYLILIDSRQANSQQLKLFEYLVNSFRNENMSVTWFFYRNAFSTFYNKEYPAGLSFKRLSEQYREYTLIIYGNAHHLVYDGYPTLNTERFNELAEWENKAILTPIPFKDWNIHEKLIGSQMILLPADAEGQLRLIKAINEKLLRHNDYLSSIDDAYSAVSIEYTDTNGDKRTRQLDFTKPEDIKDYLHDEDLFQWLCSIAIYPRLRWEVLIELGKAVLQRRDCPGKMNYSNLLKLSRISWLQDGYFPESTRLKLLKELGVAEEMTARQKLVEIFEYANLYFKGNHLFSDEKELQDIINKFVIYAHEPDSHPDYLFAKEQFEILWNKNKIADAPLKEYLDNAGEEKWETPLKQGMNTMKASEYFHSYSSFKEPRWVKKLDTIFSILSVSAFILLLLLGFVGNTLTGSTWRSLGIVSNDSSRLTKVTLVPPSQGYCLRAGLDSSDLEQLRITLTDENGEVYTQVGSAGDKMIYELPFLAINRPLSLQANWTITPPSRMINPKSYPGIATARLQITTDEMKIALGNCIAGDSLSVAIKYDISSQEGTANNLSAHLMQSGYRNIKVSTYMLDDSFKVFYYRISDENVARELARLVSNYTGTDFSAAYNDQSAYRNDIEILFGRRFRDTTNCSTIPVAQLPSSLTEIWKGQRSNRLITINPARYRLWYSTGDKKSYGTYNIEAVCQSGNVFKLITLANGKYKTFFIRNVTYGNFELSACTDFANTKEEAFALEEADCPGYDRMELYYDRNTSPELDVFKPRKTLSFYQTYLKARLGTVETARFQQYLQKAKNNNIKTLDFNAFFNSALTPEASANSLFAEMQNNFRQQLSPFGITMGKPDYDGFDGTPFDRNFFWVYDIETSDFPTIFKANALLHDCGFLEKDYWVINPATPCGFDKNKIVYNSYTRPIALPVGKYTVTWEIAIDSIQALAVAGRPLAQLKVVDYNSQDIITSLDVVPSASTADGRFREYKTTFLLRDVIKYKNFEFKVWQVAPGTLKVRQISIRKE
jgi:hypothetical protein